MIGVVVGSGEQVCLIGVDFCLLVFGCMGVIEVAVFCLLMSLPCFFLFVFRWAEFGVLITFDVWLLVAASCMWGSKVAVGAKQTKIVAFTGGGGTAIS